MLSLVGRVARLLLPWESRVVRPSQNLGYIRKLKKPWPILTQSKPSQHAQAYLISSDPWSLILTHRIEPITKILDSVFVSRHASHLLRGQVFDVTPAVRQG